MYARPFPLYITPMTWDGLQGGLWGLKKWVGIGCVWYGVIQASCY